jgi:hypothetical protein
MALFHDENNTAGDIGKAKMQVKIWMDDVSRLLSLSGS